jgi:hypothetical protein
LAGIAALFGAVVWLALVPSDERRPETPLAYWLLCGGGAFVLGAATPRKDEAVVAGTAIAAPALLLAGWTAPRGDEDGLWVLWFPLLVGLGGLLAGIAMAASWTANRVRSRP